jgi:hypothetical protein
MESGATGKAARDYPMHEAMDPLDRPAHARRQGEVV